MGFRSFLQEGGRMRMVSEVNSGRMNLGVVTINLPRIALDPTVTLNKFWEIFNERMNITEDAPGLPCRPNQGKPLQLMH